MIKLNLQNFAGPIPYSITVNGEEYSVARSRDDINTTWEMDASINTDLYTINNNLVVWNDNTILQYNGVDVVPADNIESSDYTTRTASPSYKFQRYAKVSDSITNKMKNYLDIKKSCQSMFRGCSELTREQLNTILDENDTENVTTMDTMFGGCYNLSSIPLLNISNVTTMSSMFHSCYSLISVPAFDVSNVTNLDNIFTDCSNLETIHMTGMKVKFSISSSTKFTREALIEILNNLATVTSTTTLNMGSINLAKLTDEDKAIATNKGWTLLI